MRTQGTPPDLQQAIKNGIKASYDIMIAANQKPEDMASTIEAHVLDFLRQKFGASYFEAEDYDVNTSTPIEILQRLAKAIGVVCLLFTVASCGKANAGAQASASYIASPLSGYTCFAIADGDGKVVGGSCVKD